MPLVTSNPSEFHPIVSIGGAAQHLYTAAEHGIAITVPNGGNVQSNVLITAGYKAIAVGVKSTQAGQISIQRFLDEAGTIPQGAPVTAALVGGTAQVANVNDGAPFASFQVKKRF